MIEEVLRARLRRHRLGEVRPGRVDVAVERVGLAAGPPAAAGALALEELGEAVEAGPGLGSEVVGQPHRQVLVGHRHRPAFLAVNQGNWRSPGPLARDREGEWRQR